MGGPDAPSGYEPADSKRDSLKNVDAVLAQHAAMESSESDAELNNIDTSQDSVQKALDLMSINGADSSETMAQLKTEYLKINKILQDSMRNESILKKKCAEMSSELNDNSRKLQTAVKLAQNDRTTITTLTRECEKIRH